MDDGAGFAVEIVELPTARYIAKFTYPDRPEKTLHLEVAAARSFKEAFALALTYIHKKHGPIKRADEPT